jgi:NAD(P)-dependent dehydrogenase (short-subunit alcohol dehydrogenase family)
MLLASRGAKLVVADSGVNVDGSGGDASVAELVAEEIRSAGGEAVACTVNLADEKGAIGAVAACVDAFGRIDGIIHNASSVPRPAPIADLPSDDFDLCMRVNAYGAFWLTRAAWPQMAGQGYGRVVYTTSGAFYGSPGAVAYGAAKSALIGLARAFAVAGTPAGIRVNVLAPSARTRMHGTADPSSPYMAWLFQTMVAEKVSTGAAYLVSEACELNGEILSLEGGHISRVTIAENEGYFGAGDTIEEVRDAVPAVVADPRYVHPKTLNERMLWSAEKFGVADLPGAKESWT